jgi:hypothetical protein
VDAELRIAILERDAGCVAERAGFPNPHRHGFPLELDHVRASGALGRKSRTTADNLVVLCRDHHRWKTDNGRTARPLLLKYLERFE